LTRGLHVATLFSMGKTTQAQDTIYLAPAKLTALKTLAARTRIPRAELLREAVDDLLMKHKALKAPRRISRG